MAGPDAPPSASVLSVALRWALTVSLALGGAYVARNAILHARARSGTRLVMLDFARFEGCLVGAPAPRDGDAPDRVVRMAQGTGDPVWPHSCSPALTALGHDAHEVSDDDPRAEGLARNADAMDAALGEAVFWNEHVRGGHVDPPAWVGAYVALRRDVAAFAQQRGVTVRLPEVPRHPRIPRAIDAPPPPPLAVPLPGGNDATLLDTLATPVALSALLRDGRGVHTLCRIDPRTTAMSVRCDAVALPRGYEPASMRLAPGTSRTWLAALLRAPDTRRALLDPDAGRVMLQPGGEPDAHRDYFVGDDNAWAISLADRAPTLLSTAGTPVRLPGSTDVLAPVRALIGIDAHSPPLVVSIDSRTAGLATLRVYDPMRSRDAIVARWTAPAMTGFDHAIAPCHVPGARSYLVAGDRRAITIFTTAATRRLDRGATLAWSIEGLGLACDAQGLSLRRDDGAGRLAVVHCDATSCETPVSIVLDGAPSVARVDGVLLVATATSAGVHVARFATRAGAPAPAAVVFDAAPVVARSVALVAAPGGTVALFASADRTRVLVSRDDGGHFAPVALATP